MPKEFNANFSPLLQRSDYLCYMKHLLMFQRGSNDDTQHCSGTRQEERGLSGTLSRWHRGVEGGQELRWKSMNLLKSVSKALYLFCSGPGRGWSLAHALSARVLVRRSNFHSVFAIIDMRLLGSCPFHPVSIFRPGPIFAAQCSGIFAERIMGASTLVEYCGSLHTRWYCSTVWLWT